MSSITDRLVPGVANFTANSVRVGDDLRQVTPCGRSRPASRSSCTARLLEVLAGSAVQAVGVEPSSNVYSNLMVLAANLLPTTTRYWGARRTRLGNASRHVHGQLERHAPDLTLLFLERWLDWFFREFRYGARLAAPDRPRPPARFDAKPCAGPARQLDREPRSRSRRGVGRSAGQPRRRRVAVVDGHALVAEMLLDRGRVPPARSLLTAVLSRFPDQTCGLQQLVGLSFSWNNEPQQAIEVLEPLLSRKDDETAGITAGAYKRMWQANRHQLQWLEKANEVYRGSWKRCKKVNAYLGINAASTALLLRVRPTGPPIGHRGPRRPRQHRS